MSSSESEPETNLSPRAIANRKNAKRSSGPRTPAGKARSSKNATKHGLTSEATILPGEDPQAYDDRLDEWNDHYQPSGPAEQLLVERAVRASWMLDRCTLAEDSALATRIRHAADDFQLAAREEAEALGMRLIDDETNYSCYVDSRSQTATDLKEERRRNDPPLLALRLNSFAAGADWLLARWRELDATLDRISHWHYSETFRAIRLLGKRPVDVFDDAIVSLILLAANAVDPCTPSLVVGIQRLFGQSHNRPDYDRIKDLARDVPTPENGLAMLQHVVAAEIGRLETLKSIRLDPLAQLDIKCARAQAAFDDTNSGALRHRYEASRERALHRALADLARSLKDNPPVAEVPIEPSDLSSFPPPGGGIEGGSEPIQTLRNDTPLPGEEVSSNAINYSQETTSEMASFRQDTPQHTEPPAPNPPATPPKPGVAGAEGPRSASGQGRRVLEVDPPATQAPLLTSH